MLSASDFETANVNGDDDFASMDAFAVSDLKLNKLVDAVDTLDGLVIPLNEGEPNPVNGATWALSDVPRSCCEWNSPTRPNLLLSPGTDEMLLCGDAPRAFDESLAPPSGVLPNLNVGVAAELADELELGEALSEPERQERVYNHGSRWTFI